MRIKYQLCFADLWGIALIGTFSASMAVVAAETILSLPIRGDEVAKVLLVDLIVFLFTLAIFMPILLIVNVIYSFLGLILPERLSWMFLPAVGVFVCAFAPFFVMVGIPPRFGLGAGLCFGLIYAWLWNRVWSYRKEVSAETEAAGRWLFVPSWFEKQKKQG